MIAAWGERLTAIAGFAGIVVGLTACSAGISSTGDGPSVHVCIAKYFDKVSNTCKHDATSLSYSDLAEARIAFSSGSNNFASGTSRFVVRRVNDDGTTSVMGTVDNNDASSTKYDSYSLRLGWVLGQAWVLPPRHPLDQDVSYRVEVDNGTTTLGTTGFTYHPSGPSAHICTKAHFNHQRFACTRDDYSLTESAFGSAVIVYSEGDGVAFQGSNTHYTISVVNGGGTSTTQGTYDSNDTGLDNVAEEVPLSTLFANASVVPQGGTTYSVEVDNKGQLLGIATFKIHGE